jgi:ABC-type bacteriocin/lantibiotic exporter with double-glycine peptidase domain
MLKTKNIGKKRWLAPEVIQTSAIDCGPAALKCLLEGYGVSVSYERLRDACQTSVDGTSLDTIEELAGEVGLAAEQVMLPVDHLLLAESQALPALIVVRQPGGATHFVIIWQKYGSLLQVMNPATGRQWVRADEFMRDLYIHVQEVDATDWREWAGSTEFLAGLQRRLARLGLNAVHREGLIARALEDDSWRSIAALDAATRLVTSLVASVARNQIEPLLETVFERAWKDENQTSVIPAAYWMVKPATQESDEALLLQGALLLRVKGLQPELQEDLQLPKELAPGLHEAHPRSGRGLAKLLVGESLFKSFLLGLAVILTAAGLVFEALIFRAITEVSNLLREPQYQLPGLLAIGLFVVGFFLLEWLTARAIWGIGRQAELNMRRQFLEKIPRLGDRYFRSRPVSDIAERGHSVYSLRNVPETARLFLARLSQLILTVAGLVWLYPAGAFLSIGAGLLAIGLPLIVHPWLQERDLRVRTHVGALSRCYLDALLGFIPIRAHKAQFAIRHQHEILLTNWIKSRLSFTHVFIFGQSLQILIVTGLVGWLVLDYLNYYPNNAATGLLMAYWALNLLPLGRTLAEVIATYPSQRNVTLRLLEPLGAVEEEASPQSKDETESVPTPNLTPGKGVNISLRDVTVQIGGHNILENLSLELEPGSQIAVVGTSGAGKSTLAGLLLGWHKPAQGEIMVDEQPLEGQLLAKLRDDTVWVDPEVYIWNRCLTDNLLYGSPALPEWVLEAQLDFGLRKANLGQLVETLPEGLATPLGEGGTLVSGGEGQRVRLGRAFNRPHARLVILDEPFRGLSRKQRQDLLQRARHYWQGATFLCITHDLTETVDFDRVLVLEGGRILEDGQPMELATQPESLYRRLLEAEILTRQELWEAPFWRRLTMEDGRLTTTLDEDEAGLKVIYA